MKFYLPLFALAAALMFSACREQGTEAEDRTNPYFARAEKFAAEGNYNDAVAQYEQALNINPAVAKAYQKLGDLYGEKLDDPVSAIYCYQKYLKARPNAADRELITDRLDRARRNFALTLAPAGGEDFARLNPNGATAGGGGLNLTVDVPAAAQQSASASPGASAAGGKNYTLQKGDTLWNVAKKFYPNDTKGGIEKIKQANPTLNEKKLKIGATLVIPE